MYQPTYHSLLLLALLTTRFEEATYRTLRWLDRCIAAKKSGEQNLFAIVQGGLDTSLGGLREVCLEGFRRRDGSIPGERRRVIVLLCREVATLNKRRDESKTLPY